MRGKVARAQQALAEERPTIETFTFLAYDEGVLFRRLFRERLTGLFRRVGARISHIVPVLPDGSVGHGQAMA